MRGTIAKRGKTYTAYYYTHRKINGKYERKSKSGFKTKAEAQKFLNQIISDIENGVAVLGSDVLLKTYLCEWLENYSRSTNMAKNTYEGYKRNIDLHTIPYIGDIKLSKLTPDNIDFLILKLNEKGLSVTSQRYVLATLRVALNTAVKRRYISLNVVNLIDKPKPQKYNPIILTEKQLLKFIDVVIKDKNNLPLLLCASLGLRRGEALGVKWSDFDFNNKSLHIQRTVTPNKSGFDVSPCKTQESQRTLLVPQFVIDVFEAYKKEQSASFTDHSLLYKDFVFTNAEGSIISVNALNHRFKKLLKENNLPNVRIHDLRHSWASFMLSNNMSLKVTSSMLGHSNASTTLDIYAHSVLPMQAPLVEHINSFFDNKK